MISTSHAWGCSSANLAEVSVLLLCDSTPQQDRSALRQARAACK